MVMIFLHVGDPIFHKHGEQMIPSRTTPLCSVLANTPSLRKFPIACALCTQTNAERLARHGRSDIHNLRKTVQLFPRDLLRQSSSEGRTAITQAIDHQDIDALRILFEQCSEFAYTRLQVPGNEDCHTYPLHFAIQVGWNRDSEECIGIMESILDLDPTAIRRADSSTYQPLHLAAMGSSSRILRLLLSRGASVHAQDVNGKTPLHFCRSESTVDILHQANADINHQCNMGHTPTHEAVYNGTDLNNGQNSIGTPLHFATRRKSRSMMEMLLNGGACTDSKDIDGSTSLMWTMDTGRTDLVLLLFARGADPFIVDRHGSSPFYTSLAWSSLIIFKWFQDHQGFKSLSRRARVDALLFAASKASPATLRHYLHMMDSTVSDDHSTSICGKSCARAAIHKTAAACRPDLVEVLLSCGFDANTADARGITSLLSACLADEGDIYLCHSQRREICQALLDHGVDLVAESSNELTPISIAQQQKDYPLMTMFLEHALTQGGYGVPVRFSQMIGPILDLEKESHLCQSATVLIGGERICASLIKQAADEGEWDFVMTCIAGHFVSRACLQKVYPDMEDDLLDMLRMCCATRDCRLVKYAISPGKGQTNPFDYEYPDCIGDLRDLIRMASDGIAEDDGYSYDEWKRSG